MSGEQSKAGSVWILSETSFAHPPDNGAGLPADSGSKKKNQAGSLDELVDSFLLELADLSKECPVIEGSPTQPDVPAGLGPEKCIDTPVAFSPCVTDADVLPIEPQASPSDLDAEIAATLDELDQELSNVVLSATPEVAPSLGSTEIQGEADSIPEAMPVECPSSPITDITESSATPGDLYQSKMAALGSGEGAVAEISSPGSVPQFESSEGLQGAGQSAAETCPPETCPESAGQNEEESNVGILLNRDTTHVESTSQIGVAEAEFSNVLPAEAQPAAEAKTAASSSSLQEYKREQPKVVPLLRRENEQVHSSDRISLATSAMPDAASGKSQPAAEFEIAAPSPIPDASGYEQSKVVPFVIAENVSAVSSGQGLAAASAVPKPHPVQTPSAEKAQVAEPAKIPTSRITKYPRAEKPPDFDYALRVLYQERLKRRTRFLAWFATVLLLIAGLAGGYFFVGFFRSKAMRTNERSDLTAAGQTQAGPDASGEKTAAVPPAGSGEVSGSGTPTSRVETSLPEAVQTDSRFVPAVPIKKVIPPYPEAAKSLDIFGKVQLDVDVDVDEKGNVVRTTAINGPAVFRSGAEQALMKWLFKPASREGANVPSTVRITVVFNP